MTEKNSHRLLSGSLAVGRPQYDGMGCVANSTATGFDNNKNAPTSIALETFLQSAPPSLEESHMSNRRAYSTAYA